ncbi:MAG: MFS transporter [Chthoniobacterales bacterium]
MPKEIKLSFEKVHAVSRRYAWSVVGMLWLICFLNYADRQVISVIFPLLEHEFSLTKFQLGLIGSSFMWVYAGCSFLAGFSTDRFPRKQVILGGCLFWSFVTICTGWCGKFWQFIIVRALEGLGESCYFPASMSMLADYHGKTRSRAMSLHQSGVYLGTIAGSWFGAWIAMHYGWRSGFYFFGSMGVIIALLLFFILHEPRQEAVENGEVASVTGEVLSEETADHPLDFVATFHYVFQRPAVLLLMLAFAGANFVAMVFLTWMPTFLYEKFHLGVVFAGFSAVIFIQVASAISGPCSAWLADYLSIKTKNGRVIVQIMSLLLGVITIVAVGKVTSFIPLMIAMIAFGFSKGGYDAGIFATLFDHVEKKVRGSAVGMMNTIGWIGGALGPIVVGAFSTYGHGTAMNCMSTAISWSASFYGVAACLLMGVVILTKKKEG